MWFQDPGSGGGRGRDDLLSWVYRRSREGRVGRMRSRLASWWFAQTSGLFEW